MRKDRQILEMRKADRHRRMSQRNSKMNVNRVDMEPGLDLFSQPMSGMIRSSSAGNLPHHRKDSINKITDYFQPKQA